MLNKRVFGIIICLLIISFFIVLKIKNNNKSESVFLAYYIDNQASDVMPKQNSGYMFDYAECTDNTTVEWNYAKWSPVINNLSEPKTKCILHFKKAKTVSTVLGNLEVYEYTPDFSKSACDNKTCGSHEKGIYETIDADGPTYYYRGSVDNNYFYFADLWWRIVRINGDGTIRLIYDGTTAHENGEVSADRYYQAISFNNNYEDNMYLGYMYTSGQTNGLGTSSSIKTANDAFYDTKLASHAEYIDLNAGFCGDRSPLNTEDGYGTGTVTTYNKGYLRVLESKPSLICENASDLYTMTNANKGNKALTKPIGLLTADEALLSGVGGGVFNGYENSNPTNANSYLTTGKNFWTMTPAGGYNPYGFEGWYAYLFYIKDTGLIDDVDAVYSNGLRPVINIKSDVAITGTGTIDNPYKVH